MKNGGILYVFPIFQTAGWGQKIRYPAADDLFRGSLETFQFRVIARPQRGRGNLKAEGMASRNEARDHKTRNCQDFNLSQRDTTIATLWGAISCGREAVYHMRKHISRSEAAYHCIASAVLRSGMAKTRRLRLPRRAQRIAPSSQ